MANDIIKRRDALAVIETANSMAERLLEATRKLCMTMNNISAVDAVPVVRCKNCLRWKRDAYGGVCDRYGVRLDKDWFCAGGEKRKAQHDD